jgi:glycosyltransferase involved in cell wall biosynthesis
MTKKILILYTEPPTYFLACVRKFTQLHSADVHIVQWPQKMREAPYEAIPISQVTYHERLNYSDPDLVALAKSMEPNLILCGSWKDKAYLSICRYFYGKVPVILALDHKWHGTIQERIKTFLIGLYIQKCFSHVWIPGEIQREYAKHLGFSENRILKGFYSADLDVFSQQKNGSRKSFAKRFFFSGRFLKSKGLRELWGAMLDLEAEGHNQWELWCIGTGPLDAEFPKHPRMKSLGFVRPERAAELMKEGGVFVLPSHHDAWSVSVHEGAASGMPLICSDEVGAIHQFLKEGYNGYVHSAKDKESLKTAMRKMMTLDDQALFDMGKRSAELAREITPDAWADTLWQVANGR